MKKFKAIVSCLIIASILLSVGACSTESTHKRKKKKRHNSSVSFAKSTEETEPTYDLYPTEPYESDPYDPEPSDGKTVINLWSFTDEVPGFVDYYIETHPDFAENYEVVVTIIAASEGAYQPALDTMLVSGNEDAPDIYCVESGFVYKYTQGTMAEFAAAYSDLGIDVNNEIEAAGLAQYTVDIGTRSSDNQVVALSYNNDAAGFIYRRSIAYEVFGTDDPVEIGNYIGSGTGNFDAFFETANTLGEYGYPILSSISDLWDCQIGASTTPWVMNDSLIIDDNRMQFMDNALLMTNNNWTNGRMQWGSEWYEDMEATENTPFGYFGPSWLVNYVLADTNGDWAVCPPPVGFYWGGNWVLANANSSIEKQEGVAELLRWMTLDTSETGLQYMLANDCFYGGGFYEAVASSVVMNNSVNTNYDRLGGQNPNEVFVASSEMINIDYASDVDSSINIIWIDAVQRYVNGELTRDEAIDTFRENIFNQFGYN